MNIVIAGAGEVGSHLAKMLAEEKNNNLTIIDKSEARLEKLSEIADVVTLAGDPTSIEVLMTAGVDKADLFVAVSPASEQDINIISALLAKKMGSKKVTARINNEDRPSHADRHNGVYGVCKRQAADGCLPSGRWRAAAGEDCGRV